MSELKHEEVADGTEVKKRKRKNRSPQHPQQEDEFVVGKGGATKEETNGGSSADSKSRSVAVPVRRSYALSEKSALEEHSKSIDKLREAKDEFDQSQDELLNRVNDEFGKGRPPREEPGLMDKLRYSLLPKFLQSQELRGKFEEEEEEENPEFFEKLENKMRGSIDKMQLAELNLVNSTKTELAELEALERDLTRAGEENWDARELHDYLLKKTQIKVYKEISEFLDNEFSFLSEEKKEERKHYLLKQIGENIKNKKGLVETEKSIAYAGLILFEDATVGLNNFIHIVRPLIAIREAAKAISDLPMNVELARDAVNETFTKSMGMINAALVVAETSQNLPLMGPSEDFAAKRDELSKRVTSLTGIDFSEEKALPNPKGAGESS